MASTAHRPIEMTLENEHLQSVIALLRVHQQGHNYGLPTFALQNVQGPSENPSRVAVRVHDEAAAAKVLYVSKGCQWQPE